MDDLRFTDAVDGLRAALERYEHARMRRKMVLDELAQNGDVDDEVLVESLYAVGVARAAVDAARLRLKLMGGEERILEVQTEHCQRYPLNPEAKGCGAELGTLEEAESDAMEAEARFHEADGNV